MSFFSTNISVTKNQIVDHPILETNKCTLTIKREDEIHPIVSGNKFRKLKYNLLKAKKENHAQVLTFGGAYSNHIIATAEACKMTGLSCIGVIRGDELGKDIDKTLAQNETLCNAAKAGMRFKFISREDYKNKNSLSFLADLKKEFGAYYQIPEGGTNALAVKGCEEILSEKDNLFDVICVAVGTGGTIAGISNSATSAQKIIGFPALKGDFLSTEIQKFTSKTNWELNNSYHFGGYGKINRELIDFINKFADQQKVLLDPIYTGKMVFGILDLVQKGYFKPNTRILAIHTGGLQGIVAMNNKLLNKNYPLITI